jgi:integrase
VQLAAPSPDRSAGDADPPVIFPRPLGRLRDPNNTSADPRKALDRAGFPWVTSHTFRRTIATRLDDAGLSARQIADHLGQRGQRAGVSATSCGVPG